MLPSDSAVSLTATVGRSALSHQAIRMPAQPPRRPAMLHRPPRGRLSGRKRYRRASRTAGLGACTISLASPLYSLTRDRTRSRPRDRKRTVRDPASGARHSQGKLQAELPNKRLANAHILVAHFLRYRAGPGVATQAPPPFVRSNPRIDAIKIRRFGRVQWPHCSAHRRFLDTRCAGKRNSHASESLWIIVVAAGTRHAFAGGDVPPSSTELWHGVPAMLGRDLLARFRPHPIVDEFCRAVIQTRRQAPLASRSRPLGRAKIRLHGGAARARKAVLAGIFPGRRSAGCTSARPAPFASPNHKLALPRALGTRAGRRTGVPGAELRSARTEGPMVILATCAARRAISGAGNTAASTGGGS